MKIRTYAMIEIATTTSNNGNSRRYYYRIIVHTKTGKVFMTEVTQSHTRIKQRNQEIVINSLYNKGIIIEILYAIVNHETGTDVLSKITIESWWPKGWVDLHYDVVTASIEDKDALPYLASYVVKNKLLEET